MKLPAHTSDILQPLYKCCFRPLKAQCDKKLVEVQCLSSAAGISKANFTQLVDDVWPISLSPENIKSGFISTGIHTLDSTKYPKSRFCIQILASYNLQNSPTKYFPTASASLNLCSRSAVNLDHAEFQTLDSEEQGLSGSALVLPCVPATVRSSSGFVLIPPVASDSILLPSFEELLRKLLRQSSSIVVHS